MAGRRGRRAVGAGGDNSRSSFAGVALVVLAVVVAAIPFCCGKYLEFSQDGPFDGALNVYSAKCIVDGQRLYEDVFPTARPATLLVNVIGVWLFGYSEFGAEVIQTLMQIAALGLMFYTLRKVYGFWPSAVGLFLAAFYLSCPPFAKYGNVKEQFMIASMLISACSLILCHVGARRWWLLISGGFAINVYFFKPTGLSVVIAMVVYLLAAVLFRYRKFWDIVVDAWWLTAGAVVGILPVGIFFAWQGKLKVIVKSLPGVMLLYAVVLCALLAVLFVVRNHAVWGMIRDRCRFAAKRFAAGIRRASRYERWKDAKHLRYKVIGVAFVVFILVELLMAMVGLSMIDVVDDVVLRPICTVLDRVIFVASGSGDEYVAGSRKATTFASQYAKVVGNYVKFVVPIGVSLLGIFWAMGYWPVRFVGWVRGKNVEQVEGQSDKVGVNCFVVLLGVWWVLDMLFIWVSPRNYVEYFLPLNGSAAMLCTYCIYRCGKRPGGFVWLLGMFIFVDAILQWVGPGDGAFGFALRSGQEVGAYWKDFGIAVGALVVASAIWFLIRKDSMRVVQVVGLGIVCVVVGIMFNGMNLEMFGKRIGNVNELSKSGGASYWQLLGDYIKDNSSDDDGLYVWGWLPGIYVRAQRLSPSKMPAYGDMHTDDPDYIAVKIEKMVEEFKASPPKYIVDSQKIHFPFYEHPVFDLWPYWRDKSRRGVGVRIFPNHQFNAANAMDAQEVVRYKELILETVEKVTFSILTNPKRPGGAVADERASQMAKAERLRHQAMWQLREFVTENYRIVKLGKSQHILFKRK